MLGAGGVPLLRDPAIGHEVLREGPVCLHPLRQGKQELTFPAGAG